MNIIRSSSLFAATAAVLGLSAIDAGAQQIDAARVASLTAHAVAAEESAARGETPAIEVARIYLELAEVQKATPAQSIASLRNGAMYLSHTRPVQAAALMEVAADRAMEIGDIVTAANAYLDAASMLLESGNRKALDAASFGKVQGLIARAKGLAESPLLSTADRERILRRTGPADGHFAG